MSEIKEKLQDLEKGLESLGQAPVVVGKDTDTTAKSYDAAEGAALQRELRKRFKQMSSAEITEMLDIQASRENGKQASSEVLNTLAVANPQIAKLLDASGGAALIRQDLEPMLYALFVKRFPLFERMRKEPANGLVHAYNQQTSYGDAVFQTELGTVTDDVNVYARQTTNAVVFPSSHSSPFSRVARPVITASQPSCRAASPQSLTSCRSRSSRATLLPLRAPVHRRSWARGT